MAGNQQDLLDKSVAFLAKRDGTDKVLKLLRYAVKLVLATSLAHMDTPAARALGRFESSVGTSRKAFKLGKFLADANKLRRMRVGDELFLMQLLGNGGNLVYLFMEQMTWLVKAGVLPRRRQARISLISAWAELVGYCGSLTLSGHAVLACMEQEAVLERLIAEADGKGDIDSELQRQLSVLRAKRFLKLLAIVQDTADSMLAVNDIRGGKSRLSNPALLCTAGLLSAAISAHKNWPT